MPQFLSTTDPEFEAAFQAVLGAKREDSPDVEAIVADIIADVRARGDAAVIELTAKFDRLELDAARDEWKQMVNSGLRTALVSSQQTLLSDGLPKVMPLAGLYARSCSLILSPDIDALVLIVQDDEFLNTGLPFDAVTVVRDDGGELVSHREKSPLSDEQANQLRLLLKSWVRGADDGVQEA